MKKIYKLNNHYNNLKQKIKILKKISQLITNNWFPELKKSRHWIKKHHKISNIIIIFQICMRINLIILSKI